VHHGTCWSTECNRHWVCSTLINLKPQSFHRSSRFARHDWGAQLAYEAARQRPDVFTGVVGITIPVKFPSARILRASRLSVKTVYSRSRTTCPNGGSGGGTSPLGVPALLRQADPRSHSRTQPRYPAHAPGNATRRCFSAT
jgi:pimeloyl-ACP methyl ester carboxylesterase